MLRAPAATLEEMVLPQVVRDEPNDRIVHRTASIGQNVTLGKSVRIDAFAVVDDNSTIEDNVVIGAYVYVGPMVTIGNGSLLHPHVTIRDQVKIGANVIINCGSIIGSDGFGFANNSGVNHKIPQVGKVEVEDNVWIGSNVTIDRATIGETRIRRGARIDNLAQIGHNVEIGEDTVVRTQVGVAGSTRIGMGCSIGEKTGIAGHIEIGDGVFVEAFSGVFKGLNGGSTVMGTPAKPIENEKSLQKLVRDLPNIIREVKYLKRKLNGSN